MYAYKPQLIDLQLLKKPLILNIIIVLYKAYVLLYRDNFNKLPGPLPVWSMKARKIYLYNNDYTYSVSSGSSVKDIIFLTIYIIYSIFTYYHWYEGTTNHMVLIQSHRNKNGLKNEGR